MLRLPIYPRLAMMLCLNQECVNPLRIFVTLRRLKARQSLSASILIFSQCPWRSRVIIRWSGLSLNVPGSMETSVQWALAKSTPFRAALSLRALVIRLRRLKGCLMNMVVGALPIVKGAYRPVFIASDGRAVGQAALSAQIALMVTRLRI